MNPFLPSRAAQIPDHRLIRCIGQGSYGEVWLAQNALCHFRAVKIVYREKFSSDRPFEREFKGIQKFEPISRGHEGLVDILHVGRNDEEGYFYYVMELADDVAVSVNTPVLSVPDSIGKATAPTIDPASYLPRTLAMELKRRGHLPVNETVDLGVALSSALAYLHGRGLIHRDIKPSNIIFVNGQPKLADIGLIADVGEARSYVGTEGFIPPEGPGTVQSDIYSLGKVLYEISTGKDRHDFPELPSKLDDTTEEKRFAELNDVMLKACRAETSRRYKTATELNADLLVIQSGRSLRQQRAAFRRGLWVGLAVSAAFIGAICLLCKVIAEKREASERRDFLKKLGAPYRNLTSYSDHASGHQVTEKSSISFEYSFVYQRPNKLRAVTRMIRGFDDIEIQFLCDGKYFRTYFPAFNEYTEVKAPKSMIDSFNEGVKIDPIQEVWRQSVKIYDLLMSRDITQTFSNKTKNLRITGETNWNGEPAYIIRWQESPSLVSGTVSGPLPIPVTLVATKKDGLFRASSLDATELFRAARKNFLYALLLPNATNIVLANEHTDIQINAPLEDDAFDFHMPPGAHEVSRPSMEFLSSAIQQPVAFSKDEVPVPVREIPPRPREATPQQLDLSQYFNGSITCDWMETKLLPSQLMNLPIGLQRFDNVSFDVRGVIQLTRAKKKPTWLDFPSRVSGIAINQNVSTLHFLHTTLGFAAENAEVAKYILHFESGATMEIPVRYGQELRHWMGRMHDPMPGEDSMLAWTGRNPFSHQAARIYHTRWKNTRPSEKIVSLDFVSAVDDSAPVLLAVTVEP